MTGYQAHLAIVNPYLDDGGRVATYHTLDRQGMLNLVQNEIALYVTSNGIESAENIAWDCARRILAWTDDHRRDVRTWTFSREGMRISVTVTPFVVGSDLPR